MRRKRASCYPAIRYAALALVALSASPASAHCFTSWRYPWPQHCRATALAPRSIPLKPAKILVAAPIRAQPRPSAPILTPIPFVAFVDIVGGEADEITRGRLMLHAILRKEAK